MDFPSLRTAGDGLSNIKQRVVSAARGLRMPGTMPITPAPPVAAAPAPAAPAPMAPTPAPPSMRSPTGTPFPSIDPSLIPEAPASMRAPSAPAAPVAPVIPEIPTLTDVIKPGMGPNRPVPPIPTLTDALYTSGANLTPDPVAPAQTRFAVGAPEPTMPSPGSVPRSGMGGGTGQGFTYGSATAPPNGAEALRPNPNFRTADGVSPQARAAGFGGATVPPAPPGFGGATVPPAPPGFVGAPEAPAPSMGANMAGKVRGLGTVGLAAASPILDTAMSFAPHLDALGRDSPLDAGQQAKLFARDTTRAVGAGLGGALAGGIGSAAGPVGTIAGGVAGTMAGFAGAEALSGGVRRGLNWINETAGGSPDYITDTDDDLRKAGFDPSKTAFSMARDAVMGPANAATKLTGAVPLEAPAAPAAPTQAGDITAFNARMQKINAPTVGMRTGADGPDSRELFNTNRLIDPNSIAAQASASYQAQRTATQTAADANNGRLAERQLADQKMQQITSQKFDGSRFDDALSAGRQPFSTQPRQDPQTVALDRAAAQKDFESSKALRAQGVVAMRNQDTTSDDARLTQQTAMINGMRAQNNADRQYGLELNKTQFEQERQSADDKDKRDVALTNKVAGMIPPGADGKADTAAAAQHMLSINAYLGERKGALTDHLAMNPKDRGAQAELAEINKGTTDESFLRKMVLGQQMKDIVGKTATGFLNPKGTAAVNSDAPITSMRAEDGWFGAGTNYRTNRGDVIPARYVDKVDPTFGLGGVPNRNFDILKEKK